MTYPYAKKPAFFRVTNAELFFEAEAEEADVVLGDAEDHADLDAELDAILSGIEA